MVKVLRDEVKRRITRLNVVHAIPMSRQLFGLRSILYPDFREQWPGYNTSDARREQEVFKGDLF